MSIFQNFILFVLQISKIQNFRCSSFQNSCVLRKQNKKTHKNTNIIFKKSEIQNSIFHFVCFLSKFKQKKGHEHQHHQHYKMSNFQNSTFQIFKIPKFQKSTFQIFKMSNVQMFQNFKKYKLKISYVQIFKVYFFIVFFHIFTPNSRSTAPAAVMLPGSIRKVLPGTSVILWKPCTELCRK